MKSSGLTLWQGKSPFDGSPIVAIATLESSNVKTGNMIQIWILRTDISPCESSKQGLQAGNCTDCSGRSTSSGGKGWCYVNVSQAPQQVYTSWKAGKYPVATTAHLPLFVGRVVRLGAYGDPALIPFQILQPILAVCKAYTGYTHAWKHAFAQPYVNHVMASCESLAGYDQAKAAGWRTFRAIAPNAALESNERMCPAETKGVQCINCSACHGGKGRDICITVHGKKGNVANFVNLTVKGVL